jgi:predicted glycosyltransferase
MKKLLFYCQHILGMGHLVRSMEIVRGLVKDFQVCFINGGEIVEGFTVPDGVEVVNLPALKTDTEFQTLHVVDGEYSLEEVQAMRTQQLLAVVDRFQPDIVAIELFPFGRKKFAFELIPMLAQIKASKKLIKVACSLRDIVVGKKDQAKHEDKVCRIMNQYFDLLLVHSDRHFIPLSETFSRESDLTCDVRYTGYVSQPINRSDRSTISELDWTALNCNKPKILVSVGGGRFGHELLESIAKTAPILAQSLPHHIYLFTGPFAPESLFQSLQQSAADCPNLTVRRYTTCLLDYMQQSDLSISMGGYNTTMNVLATGARSLMLPFTGNGDKEQEIRATKLAEQGILELLSSEDLIPEMMAKKIISALKTVPALAKFDLQGVQKTSVFLRELAENMAVETISKEAKPAYTG